MTRKIVFVLWGTLLVQLSAWGQCLQGPTNYAAGRGPGSVAVADFNGDGKPDLVVANEFDDNVSVLLGKGDGTFHAALNSATFVSPVAVAAGDFNADGKPDLAVANQISGSVSVLTGVGDGTFTSSSRTNYATGDSPGSVAVGDFNNDGKPDLIVVNSSTTSSVSVLVGKGDGTFQDATNFPIDQFPDSVIVGNFDGDGNADLAISMFFDNKVLLFRGQGNGTFQAPGTLAVGNIPRGLAAADLNADGKADLAVANSSALSNSVSVLLGNGDGTFQAKTDYAAGAQPRSVAVGDLNGDGKPDLAVPNNNSNSVSVLLGNGDGTFQAKTDYAVGEEPQSVAVGDFDANGKLDLAAANNDDANVSVLLNVAPTYTVEVSGARVCAGQSLTLTLTASCPGGTLTAQLSDASGSFANPVGLGSVTAGSQAVTIPANTAAGTGYRIRVVSTNPEATSEASEAFTVNVPGVAKPTVAGAPVCNGQAITVQFSAICPGTLTAQLSDASGGFGSPVNLGPVSSGSNQVVIPVSTVFATGYRIRIVGTNPSLTSEASEAFTVNVPGVAKPTVAGAPVCNGQAITVQFSATCPGTLTAQLSDQNGSFSAPVSLGVVTAGSPSVTIPAGTTAGTGYRVRIVGTNPSLTSEASEAFTVNTLFFASAPTLTGAPLCAGQAVTLTFGVGCAASALFQAQLSDRNGSFAAPVSLGAVTPGSPSVPIPAGTPSGTGYRIRVVSSGPDVISEPSAAFTVNALGNVSVALYPATPGRICLGQELPVTFSTTGACAFPVSNGFTVQLSSNTGSFANPLTLGAAQPGTSSFALPPNLPAGTGYRVRILSSNPAQTSQPSAPFELRYPTLSSVTPGVGGVPVCRGNPVTVSFSLVAGSCAFPEDNGFTAQLSSATGSFASPIALGTVVPGVGNALTIPPNVAAGTGYRIRVVSSSPQLTSLSSIPFRVNACASRMSAEEAQLVVAPNPVSGREIRVRVSGMENPEFSLSTGMGRRLGLSVKTDGSGEFVLTPRQVLTPGVYAVQVTEGTSRLTRRVLVVE